MFDSVTFGSNVKRIRTELGFSKYSFSSELHISEGYLKNIELGYKTPSIDVGLAMINLLKVGFNDCLDLKNLDSDFYTRQLLSDLYKLDGRDQRRLLKVARVLNNRDENDGE